MSHPDRLKELTEGAERDAREAFPDKVGPDGEPIYMEGPRHYYAKGLLKSALRAEGLVEAIDDLMRACKAVTKMSIVCPEDAEMEVSQCGDALRSARAALHAFNTNKS